MRFENTALKSDAIGERIGGRRVFGIWEKLIPVLSCLGVALAETREGVSEGDWAGRGRGLLRFRSCSDFERSEERTASEALYTFLQLSLSLSLSLARSSLVPVGVGSLSQGDVYGHFNLR